jgi:hypothetical protein
MSVTEYDPAIKVSKGKIENKTAEPSWFSAYAVAISPDLTYIGFTTGVSPEYVNSYSVTKELFALGKQAAAKAAAQSGGTAN